MQIAAVDIADGANLWFALIIKSFGRFVACLDGGINNAELVRQRLAYLIIFCECKTRGTYKYRPLITRTTSAQVPIMFYWRRVTVENDKSL